MDNEDVEIGCGCGRVQVLHTSQVSTILSTRSETSFGWFAALSTVFICAAVACHHLKCSLRSSLRLAASSAVRSAFVVRCMSNFDQSVGASPVVVSL